MSETAKKHREAAPKKLGFAILVCSSSRYRELQAGRKVDDPSGDLIVQLIQERGYKVVFKTVIPDSSAVIRAQLRRAVSSRDVDAIIVCGGTGVSPSDVTIETLEPLLEKRLPGFGEIFRWLSYQEVGSAAVLTRSLAGIIEGKVVYCVPGSPQAVRLALEKLILPETAHIIKHARERS